MALARKTLALALGCALSLGLALGSGTTSFAKTQTAQLAPLHNGADVSWLPTIEAAGSKF